MTYSKSTYNFDRDVWCILGLPFDALSMDCVIDKLHLAVTNKTPCFLSTPNLNFLIESQNDSVFKNSVINSELSVPDGKPIIWLARLFNIPIPERVAGSDLVEALIKNRSENKILKIFFFGGEAGIAELACEKLNVDKTGLQCVGNLNPGFGSIDDMSTEGIIKQINKCNADFVIVSLGAKKGQAWIEKNRNKLNAPIISHLGAVVNFIAGTVTRSPKALQNLGLEWLWRIKEEPLLWKRYFNDATSFFYLFIFRVLPLFIIIKIVKKKHLNNKHSLEITEANDVKNIELGGSWVRDNIDEINKLFKNVIEQKTKKTVSIFIKKGSYVDSALIAKILILKSCLSNRNRKLVINTESKLITKIFRYNCCEYLLQH